MSQIERRQELIAVVADLHLNNSTYGKRMSNGLALKTEDAIEALDFIVDECIARGISHLIFAGDIYDNANPTSDVRGVFNERMQRLIDAGILVTLMVGNHDACSKHHTLVPLKGWNKNLRIVDRFGMEVSGEICYVYVPHTDEVERKEQSFKDYIKILSKNKKLKNHDHVVMFGHFPVCGACQNDKSVNGNDRNVSIAELKELGFEICFLGDFHKRQLLCESPRIMYIGSPERKDFNEANQEKGFCTYNTDTREVDWVNYNARRMIELSGENLDEILEGIDKSDLTDAIVKVRVIGDEGQYAHIQQRFSEISNAVSKNGAAFFVGLEKPVSSRSNNVEKDDEDTVFDDGINIFTLIENQIRKECKDEEVNASLAFLEEVKKEVAASFSMSGDKTSGRRTIRFKWLRLHNFCRFGEKDNVVNFDELFSHTGGELSGVASIIGAIDGNEQEANGAGKSTILEAIAYVLYERMPRLSLSSAKLRDKTKKTTTEIIRTDDEGKYACDESYAELCFSVEGHEWIIKRGRKVTRGGKGHDAILELTCDGNPENERKSKGPNETIIDLIGMEFEPFCNSVFFAQKDTSKLFTSTSSGRIDTLLNVLGVLSDVNSALEIVRAKKSDVKTNISRLEGRESALEESSEGDEVKISDSIKSVHKRCEDLDLEISGIDEEIKKKKILVDDALLRKEKANAVLIEKENEAKKIEQEKGEERKGLTERLVVLKGELDSERNKTTEFKRQKLDLRSDWNAYNAFITKTDIDAEKKAIVEIEQLKAAKIELENKGKVLSQEREKINRDHEGKKTERRILRVEIDRYRAVLEFDVDGLVKCPHCGSNVPIIDIQSKINESEKKLDGLDEEIVVLRDELSRNTDESVLLSCEIKSISDKISTETSHVITITEYEKSVKGIEVVKNRAKALENGYKASKGRDEDTIVSDIGKTDTSLKDVDARYAERLSKCLENILEAKCKLDSYTDLLDVSRKSLDKEEVSRRQKEDTKKNFEIEEQKLKISLESLLKFKNALVAVKQELDRVRKEQIRVLKIESILGSDGIKTKIVDVYIPVFNSHMSTFMSILTGGRMSVCMEPGTMDPVIRGASSSIYDMLSGGEQDVIRLASNLSLGMVSLGSSRSLPETLFLDEVFGSLSPAVQERVFDLLSHLRTFFERILVITHNPRLRNRFNSMLLVEKNDGVSRVSILS